LSNTPIPTPGDETVEVDFTLGLGSGHVRIQAHVPTGQTNLTRLLPVLQSMDNVIIDSVVNRINEDGRSVSCKAGCGACCRQMVPISIFEAEALGEWLSTLPKPQQDEIRRRFHLVLTSLSEAGLLDRIVTEDWFADTKEAEDITIEYFRQGLACPFLQDESCSIHPIRPLSCREYLVTSPAELCADPARNLINGIELPVKLSRALYRMGAELEGGPRGWIPFIFLFAWLDGGFHPGEAFAGAGPQVLYEFVQRLATSPANGGRPS
jgi:Fe-S-cluster containining protein